MSLVLLHISDPHFGTQQSRVVQALQALEGEQSPNLVLVSGDITQRATAPQFAEAKAFLGSLSAPTLVIPGNHDIPLFALGERLLDPYRRYRATFGAKLDQIVELPECMAISLNTTRWYRHEDGEVSPTQIRWVQANLQRANPGQLRLVVVHQPVAVTLPCDLSNRLHGRDTAVPRWAEAGADLVLGGHIHLPFVRSLHEEFGGCARKMWAVQAGTALSTRVRSGAPNSVNLIRYASADSPRRCIVEQWDFKADASRFALVHTHALGLSATRAI